MVEVWKDVPGYEGLYQVSSTGNVKSLPKMCGFRKDKGKILSPFINTSGYELVTLCKNNNQKHFQVHRLVAMAFIPNINNKPQVDHINRVRTDNRVENLRWVTVSENGCNMCLNQLVTYKGESKTVGEWSKICGIKQGTLYNRIFIHGWSVEKAFSKPTIKRTKGVRQSDAILEYLKCNEYISKQIALEKLGIKQLNPRITELRNRGYIFSKCKINKEIRYSLNRSEE